VKKKGRHGECRPFLSARLSGRRPRAVYSQQGIVTSSQQSSPQQGAAANAAVEASAKAKIARSFFMNFLEG
jgi:hypothetical protein